MRKVFKEIFSRYIEEREEVNSGGDNEDSKTSASQKRSSTSYARPASQKTKTESTSPSSDMNKRHSNAATPGTTTSGHHFTFSSHPEAFVNPHGNGGLHGGFPHGAHHNNHRGGRGPGAHKPRAVKAKAAKRRRK